MKTEFMNIPPMQQFLGPILATLKLVGTFVLGYFTNLLTPHIKKQFDLYNSVLTEISYSINKNAALIYTWELKDKRQEHMEFHEQLRELRAKLLSSLTNIPKIVLRFLQLLHLIRSDRQIQRGAGELIGLSNFILQETKDRALLTKTVKAIGDSLGIDVGQ